MSSPVEKSSLAPSKHAIAALYADRTFGYFGDRAPSSENQPKALRKYLNLRPDITRQLLCPPEIAEKIRAKKLHTQLLNEDADHPIQLVIRRKSTVDPDKLEVALSIKESSRTIAELELELLNDLGHHFDIYHRLVLSEFRGPQNSSGERLSNILLKAAEDYVRHIAEQTKKPQQIGLKTNQLEVILWMLENGYGIIDEDKKWWEKIQAGDPHLVMLKGHFCLVKDPADISNLRRQEVDHSYFFTVPPVEIHFKKIISPVASSEAVVKEVRRAVAGS